MEEKEIEKIYNLIEKGEYVKAKELLADIVTKDERDIDALKLVALCDVNVENYDKARQILEDVIKYRQDDAICWYYLGCCYDNLGQLIEAKHAYTKVIELRPEYVDVYKSMAIVQIKAQEPQKALEYVEQGLKYADKDDYALYYIAGTACMAAQDFEGSIKYIEKAIKLDPKNVQLYNNLGTAYLTTGKLDKAIEIYEKSIELEPSDSLAYFNIASILQMQENHEKACEYFAKAHNLEPEDNSYIIAWAISEIKANKISDAIEHYKYLSAVYPQKTTYKFNLASCLQMVGQYEAAISILIQLSMMNPKSVNILKKLASVYIMTGQISNAKEIYEKIIKFGSSDFMSYYELAMLCIKTGDTDRAENMLKKVTKIEPNFANAHKDLAVIYLNKRLFDYAKDEFERAYECAPDDFSIILEYANYFHATSDFEKADQMYQKALLLKPESPTALAFSALNKTHLKQINEALEQIKNALTKSPASAFLFFIAGRIYFLSEDFDRAKDYLIKSFEMEKLPETQNLLALCYFNQKDFNQAKIIFNNMLEKSPMNINTLLNVAKCCIELKQTDEALQYLDKIVDTFPECEEAQELIREIS